MNKAIIFALILLLSVGFVAADFNVRDDYNFRGFNILGAGNVTADGFILNGSFIDDWSDVNLSGGGGSGSGDGNIITIQGSTYITVQNGTVTNISLNTAQTDSRYLRDIADSVDSTNIGAAAVGSSELASTGTDTGSFGGANRSAQLTVDADGRITGISQPTISILWAQVSNFAAGVIAAISAQYPDLDTDSTDDFSGSWNDLTSIPAGFDDDVDNDTTYTDLSEFNNDVGFITDYTVTEADVTQHEAALTITESQITDLTHTTDTNCSVEGSCTLITYDSELDYYTDADISGSETAFDGWDKDASDDFDGVFSSLMSIPSGLSDGDDDTTYSESDPYLTLVGTVFGFDESALNATIDARDTDTDTTYTAGTGLTLSSEEFSVLLAYRLPQSCNNGEIAEYNSTSGGWDCAIDNSASSGIASFNWGDGSSTTSIGDGETIQVTAGTGITTTLSGNNVEVASTVVDTDTNETTRVDAITDDCSAGDFVQNITDAGIECATPDYYTDSDIDGSESAFTGWDKNAADDFDGVFSSLTSIPSGLSDGDDDTTYSESDPYLTLAGTVFGVDESALNATIDARDTDTQLSEAQVEAFVFDADNTGTITTSGNINVGDITADTARFGGTGVQNLRAFNIYGTGLDGRLSLQGGSGDNPGLEMTTDGNDNRVLLRLQEVGADGTSLQIYTELEGGGITNYWTFADDGVFDFEGRGIRKNSNDLQFQNSSGDWVSFEDLSTGGGGTDDQTLTWNDGTNILSIESGNSVNLSNLSIDTDTTYTAGTGLELSGTVFAANTTYLDANYVGQTEYPNLDTDSTDDFDGVFSSLTSIPSGLSDGDDDTQLTEEQVEDFVGGMLVGTETRISVTYDDGGNAINFVVDDMNDDVPESGDFGNAADLNADGSISANAVALGTDTTGNYAAGDAEAGAALTGDSATAFFSSGTIELARGGTGNTLTDPNNDRILFWDDSAGVMTWLTASTGLTLSGTSLTARSASTSQTGIIEIATGAEVAANSDSTRAIVPSTLSSIDTLGTITTGTWQGTAIADAYISSSGTWDLKLDNVVEDTTPQLGGNLDAQSNNVTSVDCITFSNGGEWCSG